MDMTLEEWRVANGLSYQQLAERIGLSTATQARRYALGIVETPPETKEAVREITGGEVTAEGFHRSRLAYGRDPAPQPEPVS